MLFYNFFSCGKISIEDASVASDRLKVVHLILSLYFFGINGVIIGIIISILFFGHGYGCYIVYNNYFRDNKYWEYLKYLAFYFVAIIICAVITYFICSMLEMAPLKSLFFRFGVCVFIGIPLLFLLFRISRGYNDTVLFIKNVYHSVR